jgi:hypothetical protein
MYWNTRATPALPEEREPVRQLNTQKPSDWATAAKLPIASLPDEEAVERAAMALHEFEDSWNDVAWEHLPPSTQKLFRDQARVALASIPSTEGLRRDYEALKKWWDMNPSLFQHRLAELEAALEDLQQAEAEYRLMHDTHGDGAQAAGRAWDLMRRAGDKARAALRASYNRKPWQRPAVRRMVAGSAERWEGPVYADPEGSDCDRHDWGRPD